MIRVSKPLLMRRAEVDPVGAINDIKRWAETPEPSFGVLTDRPARGPYPGWTFYATDTLTTYTWTGSAWTSPPGVTEYGPGTPVAATSFGAAVTACSLSVPAQPVAGALKLWGHLFVQVSQPNEDWQIRMEVNSTLIVYPRIVTWVAGGIIPFHMSARISVAAGVARSIVMRMERNGAGAGGSMTSYADSATNRIEALFIPD